MTLGLASFLCCDDHTNEKQLTEKESTCLTTPHHRPQLLEKVSTCLTIPSHRPQFWRIQGRDSHDLLGQEQKENTQMFTCVQLSPLLLC